MGIDLIARAMASQGGGGNNTTYNLKLNQNILKLIGSDGTIDKVELPGSIQEGEGKNSLITGVNSQAISQGSTAMGVDVTAGSKAFYIEGINAENKQISLKITNDIPTTEDRDGILSDESFISQVGDEFFGWNIGSAGFLDNGNYNPVAGDGILLTAKDRKPVICLEGENDIAALNRMYKEGYREFVEYSEEREGDQNIITPGLLCGYEIGDEFSVIRDKHYAFCGTIVAIYGNIITYDNYVMTGPLVKDAGGNYVPGTKTTTANTFATQVSTNGRELWEDCIFWVPKKPNVGFRIWNHDEENPKEVFQGVNTFGNTNWGSADKAFVTGEENAAGGNGATILGTRNRGAYGNLIAGGDNFSNGLHSILLGRYNTNLGNYNVLLNNLNYAEHGAQYNLLSGYNNIIKKGEGSFVGGKANSISGSCSIAFGNGVRSVGGYNALFGYSVKQAEDDTSNCTFGGGSEILYTGAGNIFGGRKHTIEGAMNATFGDNGIIKGGYNLSAGYNNQITASYSVAAGLNNKITDGTNNTVFGNDNKVSGTNNFVANGKGYTSGTDTRYNGNTVGGYSHFVSGTHNTVSGMWNFVTGFNNTTTKSHTYLLGRDLTCDTESQVVMGKQNKTDSGAALIIGKGGASNCLTVGASGTRSNVETDAVTVQYLESTLLSGEW